MIDTFDLLMKYIIENACELWVFDKNEYEENGKRASEYKINRRPTATEVVGEATMKKGSTEYYLDVYEFKNDYEPSHIEISIINEKEELACQELTIIKRDGKVTIE